MSKDVKIPKSDDDSPTPRGQGPQSLTSVINGSLLGVGGLYVATKSITVTLIGAIVAAVVAALYLLTRRQS
jgi:hypothetical protein